MSAFKYRIRYERVGNGKTMVPCVTDIYGVSAAGALSSFHRWMQLSKEVDAQRAVTRPKLSPDQYRITAIAQIYSPSSSGKIGSEMIESPFELPANPTNPDLTETKKPEDNFMGFMDNLSQGKLAQ